MGSVCCVAARDVTLPNRIEGESLQRNNVYSPSWSFRWENQGRVAGEIDSSSYQFPRGNVSREIKLTFGSERSNMSDGVSMLENCGTPTSEKSSILGAIELNPVTPRSDMSLSSCYSTEVKSMGYAPEISCSTAPKPSFSIPSSISIATSESLSTPTNPHASYSNPSRQARRSPGHQLLRQVSDSRILGLKSPSNCSISEGRPSFVLSTCSNDLTPGSQGGSSDGWSMRTFTELVASSQRERWSFNSEQMGSAYGRMSECSSRFSCSPSVDLQTCGACSKLLSERSAWSSQRIMAGADLSVVAVLFCGHVYHADCLETMAQEADRSDPACPICMAGERQISKMSIRAFRADTELKAKHHRISRNRVVDSYLDGGFDNGKSSEGGEAKVAGLEASSSTRSSFVKPFLKRRFSRAPKWSRSQSVKECGSRKKGFWGSYIRD